MRCFNPIGLEEGRGGAPRRAFTLVETVVAMGLIGLLVLSTYGAITSGMGTMRMARENLRATQILLEKMEQIRLYNWGQMNASWVPTQFIVNYDINNPSTNSGILYYGTFTIASSGTGTTYADDMKQVTVQVRWKTGSLARSRAMTTYACRSGIQNYIY